MMLSLSRYLHHLFLIFKASAAVLFSRRFYVNQCSRDFRAFLCLIFSWPRCIENRGVEKVSFGGMLAPCSTRKCHQNDPQSRQSQVCETIWSAKVSSVRLFRPRRPVALVSSCRLDLPRGQGPIVAGGDGLLSAN